MSLYYSSQKSRYGLFYMCALGSVLIITCLFTLIRYGHQGPLVLFPLITMAAITPLLIDRYRFYLFIWLFISPAFDNFREILIAGANPVVLAITGITIPFALILVFRNFKKVISDIPFISYLAAFNLVLLLNMFRPNGSSGMLLECLKIFIELFIIFCAHHEIKSGHADRMFKGINVFIIANSLIACLQRLTGFGMIMVEGLPRVGGLVGHPNCLAFVNVLYIPFAIYKIINEPNSKEKKLWQVGLVISVIALLLTLCKNVILTLLLQSGILFLFLPSKLKIRVFFSLAIISAIFLISDSVFHLKFIDQLSNRASNNSSLIWRLKIWGYLINSIDSASIMTGHGINAAKDLIGMINSRGSSYAHNAYLQLLYDYGLTGLLLMMAFIQPFIEFLSIFITASRQSRLNKIIPLLILIAIFINMASDNSVFLRTPMVFAWLFLAYLYMEAKNKISLPSLTLQKEKA